eukprot:1244243-Prymnesium_polylepis.1
MRRDRVDEAVDLQEVRGLGERIEVDDIVECGRRAVHVVDAHGQLGAPDGNRVLRLVRLIEQILKVLRRAIQNDRVHAELCSVGRLEREVAAAAFPVLVEQPGGVGGAVASYELGRRLRLSHERQPGADGRKASQGEEGIGASCALIAHVSLTRVP